MIPNSSRSLGTSALGEQVRRVAASEIGAPVAGEPRRLGELLEDQGRRVSG